MLTGEHSWLQLQPLEGRLFRASPAFRLVGYEQLPPESAAPFRELAADAGQYGVLVPHQEPALGILAVDNNSAALLQRLGQPATLPADILQNKAGIAGMVLDGILEIEKEDRFFSGPAACKALLASTPKIPEPADVLTTCSHAALQAAQALPIDDPKALSRWLYRYHHMPVTPAWAHRLSDQRAMQNHLGLQPGGAVHRLLNEHFVFHHVPGWLAWRHQQGAFDRSEPLTCKLYISPAPGVLSEVLPKIARCFVEMGVPSFKLGQDLFGILRPDKLVAYFENYRTLARVAKHLKKILQDCPSHGVPFTAALDTDGLLSWGIDPPHSELIPGWRDVESWRLWITNHLARSLLRAKSTIADSDDHPTPWDFALLRLALDGVQVENWMPTTALWHENGVTND